jgi:hypothetical protein
MDIRRVRIVAWWIAMNLVIVAVAIHTLATATSPPPFDRLLRPDPYLQLFTEANDLRAIRDANQLTGDAADRRLAELTRWYEHFHSEGSNNWPFGDASLGTSSSTLATKLSRAGAVVSNYRNGSYVSQATVGQVNWGEAGKLERQAPLAISTFWPGDWRPNVTAAPNGGGRLVGSLDPAAATVRVSTVPAAARPSGAPASWPFIASRGTGATPGAYSENTHDVVSWIRIDDELMQIVGEPRVSGDAVELDVVRGIWGTTRVAHAASSEVMSPVYIGSATAAASDVSLAGAPNVNDARATLRYAIKICDRRGSGFIADRIASTFGAGLQGYSGIWLDVSSCNQYNNADATGTPIAQWNDAAASKMTRDLYGQAQRRKVEHLRERFPGVWLGGNSLGSDNDCTRDLLGNLYDGGVLENFANPTGSGTPWDAEMRQAFAIWQHDWPGMFWMRWNRFQTDPAKYQRFAYGSVLLGYRPSATRPLLGGPFGLAAPPELFRWDLGAPLAQPASVDATRVQNGLYRRDFTNAVVLVNPTTQPIGMSLDTTYWDVSRDGSDGNPAPTTSVTVGGRDAAILLRSASEDAPPPAPSPSPDPSPAPGDAKNLPPESQIAGPLPGASLSLEPTVITGVASDDAGVAAVRVTLHDTARDVYWQGDGPGWGTDRASVDATLESPSAGITRWSLPWTPESPGSFELTASARDVAGVVQSQPTSTAFTVADDAPDPGPAPTTSVAIAEPVDGSSIARRSFLTVGGTASGPRPDGVDVTILDLGRGLYLRSDGSWGAAASLPAQLEATTDLGTPWRMRWRSPPEGRFRISAVARGASAAPEPEVVEVDVVTRDRRPPKTTLRTATSSLRSRTSGGAVTVGGHVRDRSGVRIVTVAIRDRENGRWWAGGRRWAPHRDWHQARIAGHRWSIRSVLDPGRYVVRVRAVDDLGNRRASAIRRRIGVSAAPR